MAKATRDLGRLMVSELVDIALDSESAGTGSTKQEIARAVLEKWARQRHLAFKVYARRLSANGLQMELDGIDTEDDGSRRRRAE
jgi:hypothetical protein